MFAFMTRGHCVLYDGNIPIADSPYIESAEGSVGNATAPAITLIRQIHQDARGTGHQAHYRGYAFSGIASTTIYTALELLILSKTLLS